MESVTPTKLVFILIQFLFALKRNYFFLDYAPTKNSPNLLEIKLHVPAEVKILGEFSGAKSVVYLNGIAYLCQPSSGLQVVSIAATPKLQVKRLRKEVKPKVGPRLSPRAARETVHIFEELRAKLY